MTAWGSPAGVEAKCSACRGKGGREVVYRGFTGNETCQKCFGSGYVFCRACRGIRITQVHKKGTCPQCRGRKVVKVKRQGKNNAYRGSNYIQQQRARDAAEIVSNHVYIPGYPGKLEDDLGRNALKPDPYTRLFNAEMFELFSPYPTHEETLERSTEDFNSKLERARDVYNRTGVKIDVSP